MQVISFKEWLDLYEGMQDEPYAFHAVFMAGGPASGKTTVAQSMFAGLGFKFSSSDAIYERLARGRGTQYKSLEKPPASHGAMAAHIAKLTQAHQQAGYPVSSDWENLRRPFNPSAEGENMADHPDHQIAKQQRSASTNLAIRQAKSWRQARYPLVIDVTARDKNSVVQIDQGLRELGYDTFMVFVNTELPKALERNARRGVEGGAISTIVPRAAGTKETEQFWYEVQANKEYFKYHFGDNYVEIDNSEDVAEKSKFDKQSIPTPGQDVRQNNMSDAFRNKQAEWYRIGIKLLGPPGKVKNPIGAAQLAQGTDYSMQTPAAAAPPVNHAIAKKWPIQKKVTA